MKSRLTKCSIITLLALSTPALFAQEPIDISDADISHMGIVFAPAQATDSTAGARFAATITNSPDSVATLSARYSGVIEQWHLNAGAQVSAGELLATLRSPEILATQNQWIAALSMQENAQFELRKDQALFEQGIISQQRLLQTQTHTEQASFSANSIRAQLALAGFNDTRLNALRENGTGLGSYYLIAPSNSVLSQRLGSVGDYVAQNEPLASLNADGPRWASVHVPGRLATDVSIGQTLSIAGTGETLTLRQKEYVIDSSNQTTELLAQFDANNSFIPGQVVSVVLPPSRQGVLVPDRAVVHNGNSTVVYVRTSAGVQARELDLLSVGADYLAQSGLNAGDMIAIQGSAVLKGIQLGLGSGE